MLTSLQKSIIATIVLVVLGLLLLLVFPGKIILPQAFYLFGLRLQIYGLILGLAVVLGYYVARKRAKRFKLSVEQVDSIILVVLVGGFIGARVYHIFSSWNYYWHDLWQVLAVWNGGLSIIGAVFGGLIALFIYTQYFHQDLKLIELIDWLTPSLLVGQIIGRFGNLVNYEAYGLPTSLPWKMFVPSGFRLPPYETSAFFHPTFIYEALLSLLLLIVLLNWAKLAWSYRWVNRLNFSGFMFYAWLVGYGVIRIFTEYLRIDGPLLLGYKQNLIVAIIMVLVGLFCISWKLFIGQRNVSTVS